MASVSETADAVGVARSTLLYYERAGIVSPTRNPGNGYRDYSREDIDRLKLIRQLVQAGFTLKETVDVMAGTLDPAILDIRYHSLDSQIANLVMAREVLGSLIARTTGKSVRSGNSGIDGRTWHAEFERTGPEAHEAWLSRLGFSEKERLYIRWVTRNMSGLETYMGDFFTVFENMHRQGPGSTETTVRALTKIPGYQNVARILDIGCGTGTSSLVLAGHTDARISAIDNHQPFLDRLSRQAAENGFGDRIEARNTSMFALDFAPGTFDLIWSEGSAYFMGFERALREWHSLLSPGGHLFLSDAVWLTTTPSPACTEYWKIEYPTMTDRNTREKQAVQAGYSILDSYILPREDWIAFYNDMEACVRKSIGERGMTRTFADMLAEIDIDRQYGDEYGYICLLLQKQ